MEITYRAAGGKDPLGDVIFTGAIAAHNEETALYKGWDWTKRWNRTRRTDTKFHVVTVQCGNLLLDVASGKLRSLTGAVPPPLIPQPELPLGDKQQPRLF